METKRGMDIPRFFAVLQVFNIFWESFLMEKGGGGKAMIVDSITGIKKEEYIKEQNELIRKINLNNTVDLEKIHLVAGVDLAYWRDENGGEQAVCRKSRCHISQGASHTGNFRYFLKHTGNL